VQLVEPYLVPSPGKTLQVMSDKWSYIVHHGWVTTYETLLGFVIAAIVGVLAAVIRARSASQPNNRTVSRYRRRRDTSAEDRSPVQMPCTGFWHPTGVARTGRGTRGTERGRSDDM
jgi:hypothetical protein